MGALNIPPQHATGAINISFQQAMGALNIPPQHATGAINISFQQAMGALNIPPQHGTCTFNMPSPGVSLWLRSEVLFPQICSKSRNVWYSYRKVTAYLTISFYQSLPLWNGWLTIFPKFLPASSSHPKIF